MDIDKLQSANVPSCALISKKIPSSQLQSTLLRWSNPVNQEEESSVIKSCFGGKHPSEKVRTTDLLSALYFERKNKKTKKKEKESKIQTCKLISHCRIKHCSRSSPTLYCSFMPISGTKSQRYEKEIRNTRKKDKCVKVSVCMCMCWYVKEPVWIVCTLYQKCQCNRCIAALLWWAKEMRFHSYSGWV